MPTELVQKGRTSVPIYRQENDYYCGPTVAKMTLRFLKVKRSQTQLWDAIRDHMDAANIPECEPCKEVECSPWSTPPESLHAVVAGLSGAPFKLVAELNAASTDHAIVWSVVNDIPAMVLVWGWRHWILVEGCTVSRVPANIGDTAYQLDGLRIIDPLAYGQGRDWVNATKWRTDYLTGVPCGRFQSRFVAVCDPEPRPTGGPTVGAPPIALDVFIADPAISAYDGIRKAGLLEDPRWASAMKGAKAGQPRLVHRLDRLRVFYYIVPFVQGARVAALALVDATSGMLDGARVANTATESLTVPAPPSKVVGRLAGQRFDLGGRRELPLRAEGLSAAETLVWKPCAESLTPYSPFTRLSYGDQSIYVRADGTVFRALTDASPGS